MPLLKLHLKQMPTMLGIYGKDKNFFPAKAALLHPEAAEAYLAFEAAFGRIRVSDVYRTPESSMQARSEKAGVQPPGYSAHNFGLAIDVHTEEMLARFKTDKAGLDAKFNGFGWFCHRRDGKRGFEDWHYNYLGKAPDAYLAKASKTSTAGAIEAKIQELYAEGLKLEPDEAQEALKKMRMYQGDIDGKIGPRSRQSIMAFQRAWALPETGQIDPKTERTLAIVSADFDILP